MVSPGSASMVASSPAMVILWPMASRLPSDDAERAALR
jgi:hypothetical protein